MFRNCFFFSKTVQVKKSYENWRSRKHLRKEVENSRSRFAVRREARCGRNQLPPGSISLSSLYARKTYDWHVSGGTDRILLTVPFSSIVHHFFCEPDTCALTQRISQYHRQTKRRTETDIRANRRTSRHRDSRALGQQRGKTSKTRQKQKQRQEAEDNRRIKRQEGRQGRWCGMAYTATRAVVMVGGWLCGVCVLLCVVGGVAWLCVVACVVWLCLSRWGFLSGGRLPLSLPLKRRGSLSSGGQDSRVPETPRRCPDTNGA